MLNAKKRLFVNVNRPSIHVNGDVMNRPRNLSFRLRFQNISQYKRSPSYFLATMHSCSSSNQCEQNQQHFHLFVGPKGTALPGSATGVISVLLYTRAKPTKWAQSLFFPCMQMQKPRISQRHVYQRRY